MDIFVFEDERKFKTVEKVQEKAGEKAGDKTGDKIEEKEQELWLKIVKPTQEQISEADLRYRIKFAQALRMKAMTKAQAEMFIKKENILDEETIKRREELYAQINKLRIDITDETDRAKGIEMAGKIGTLKSELETINRLTMDIYNQTAEAFADDFRLQWLCVELTQREDGTKYFKDYKQFSESVEDMATIDSIKNMILFLNNLKDNFEMEFEENKWLLDKHIIKEDGSMDFEAMYNDINEDLDLHNKKEAKTPKDKKKKKKTVSKKKKKSSIKQG